MLKVAELRVRPGPSVTGLHERSYRSIQNFARHSKRLALSLVIHVLSNEKSTGAIKRASDRNTPNDRIFPSILHSPHSPTYAGRWTFAHRDSFGRCHGRDSSV